MCVYAHSRMRLTPSVQHPARHAEMFGSLSLISARTLENFVDNAVLEIG